MREFLSSVHDLSNLKLQRTALSLVCLFVVV
jgi:hypothetical protein